MQVANPWDTDLWTLTCSLHDFESHAQDDLLEHLVWLASTSELLHLRSEPCRVALVFLDFW